MSNIWKQEPSGRLTSENLYANIIAKDFWEASTGVDTVIQDIAQSQ